MTLESDFAELQHASSLVSEIADDLNREKAKVQTQIDSLVSAGWSGAAADQYARAWREWVDGADRVLAALAAESRLLADQRADFIRTDGSVTDTIGTLHARLGPA
jgi:WXG100 family type VII secretion target